MDKKSHISQPRRKHAEISVGFAKENGKRRIGFGLVKLFLV